MAYMFGIGWVFWYITPLGAPAQKPWLLNDANCCGTAGPCNGICCIGWWTIAGCCPKFIGAWSLLGAMGMPCCGTDLLMCASIADGPMAFLELAFLPLPFPLASRDMPPSLLPFGECSAPPLPPVTSFWATWTLRSGCFGTSSGAGLGGLPSS